MTTAQSITQYLIYIKTIKNYSPYTIRNYEEYLSLFNKWLLNNSIIDMKNITLNDIANYRFYLSSVKQKDGNLHGINTQILHARAIRSWLSFYYKKQEVTIDPRNIELPKRIFKQVEFMTPEQVTQLTSVIDMKTDRGLRDRAIIELLFSTGLRVGELCSLNKDDISFSEKTFTITGKGNKQRIVFVSDEAVFFLKQYLATRIDTYPPLFTIMYREDRFKDIGKIRINKHLIQTAISLYGKKSGIPFPVYPHMLRHTFATDLLRNGCNLEVVSKLLGHSSIATTQIYSHVTNNHLKEDFSKYHTKREITL